MLSVNGKVCNRMVSHREPLMIIQGNNRYSILRDVSAFRCVFYMIKLNNVFLI